MKYDDHSPSGYGLIFLIGVMGAFLMLIAAYGTAQADEVPLSCHEGSTTCFANAENPK